MSTNAEFANERTYRDARDAVAYAAKAETFRQMTYARQEEDGHITDDTFLLWHVYAALAEVDPGLRSLYLGDVVDILGDMIDETRELLEADGEPAVVEADGEDDE